MIHYKIGGVYKKAWVCAFSVLLIFTYQTENAVGYNFTINTYFRIM